MHVAPLVVGQMNTRLFLAPSVWHEVAGSVSVTLDPGPHQIYDIVFPLSPEVPMVEVQLSQIHLRDNPVHGGFGRSVEGTEAIFADLGGLHVRIETTASTAQG